MKNPIITANTESYKTQYTVAGRLTATEFSNSTVCDKSAMEFSNELTYPDYSKYFSLPYNNYINLTKNGMKPIKPIWAGSDLYG